MTLLMRPKPVVQLPTPLPTAPCANTLPRCAAAYEDAMPPSACVPPPGPLPTPRPWFLDIY